MIAALAGADAQANGCLGDIVALDRVRGWQRAQGGLLHHVELLRVKGMASGGDPLAVGQD